MTELKRWTDEGAPEAIERLLQAAASEEPSAASLAGTLTSLGVAGGVMGLTGGAAASGAAASGAAASAATSGGTVGVTALAGAVVPGKLSMLALGASLAKWVALGTAVGGVVIAVDAATDGPPDAGPVPPSASSALAPQTPPRSSAAAGHRRAPAASTASARSRVTLPRGGPAAGGGTNMARPPAAGAPAARATVPRSVSAPSEGDGAGEVARDAIPAETLAQEISGIDRARSLLAAGRYTAVMAALDDFERRFPRHHFAPEVLYLRMDAAWGAGDTAQARGFARRLLASYPASPQSEKAKQLLEQKD